MTQFVDVELLCQEVQQFLDTDPRYFNEDEGSFEWHYERIYFTKLPEEFVLEVQGMEVSCPRL